jgi:multidrug resistance efflux pump
LAATELEVEVTKTALASAQQGLNLEQAGGERPYSKQRLDDVNLRVAVLERELHEKRLSYASLSKRIASEQQRLSENRETQLVIPSRGRVWKVRATKNEFVEKNDVVLELVDCQRMTVLTWVTERNFNRIHLNDPATLEMSGSGKQYRGRVVQLFGRMAAGGADMDLAIQNELLDSKSSSDAQRFVVMVAFEGLEKGNNCEIGQTGTVTFRPW